MAAFAIWKEMRARSKGVKLQPILAVGLLLVLAMTVNGILFLSILQS
jgi:hypothetical protein